MGLPKWAGQRATKHFYARINDGKIHQMHDLVATNITMPNNDS